MNRKHATTLIAVTILGTGLIATPAGEKKAEPKKQTTCPVMGGKINTAQFADVNGKRIYVCCAGCIEPIKADPDKYIKQLEAKGVVLDKTPKKEEHKGHKH